MGPDIYLSNVEVASCPLTSRQEIHDETERMENGEFISSYDMTDLLVKTRRDGTVTPFGPASLPRSLLGVDRIRQTTGVPW